MQRPTFGITAIGLTVAAALGAAHGHVWSIFALTVALAIGTFAYGVKD